MTANSKAYEGEDLQITLTRAEDGTIAWLLEMRASDAGKTRKLGYRARGDDLRIDVEKLFPIEVHDEERAAWTEMPVSHRKDVRGAIAGILAAALNAAKI